MASGQASTTTFAIVVNSATDKLMGSGESATRLSFYGSHATHELPISALRTLVL